MDNKQANLELALALIDTLKRLNKFIGNDEDGLPVIDGSYLEEIRTAIIREQYLNKG